LVAVASRSVKPDNNSSQLEYLAFAIRDSNRLFRYFPSRSSTALLEWFQGLERQVCVMSDHEECVALGDAKQQSSSAEVAVGDPNVEFLYQLEDFG
jgi:hypothetical protein